MVHLNIHLIKIVEGLIDNQTDRVEHSHFFKKDKNCKHFTFLPLIGRKNHIKIFISDILYRRCCDKEFILESDFIFRSQISH